MLSFERDSFSLILTFHPKQNNGSTCTCGITMQNIKTTDRPLHLRVSQLNLVWSNLVLWGEMYRRLLWFIIIQFYKSIHLLLTSVHTWSTSFWGSKTSYWFYEARCAITHAQRASFNQRDVFTDHQNDVRCACDEICSGTISDVSEYIIQHYSTLQ